MLVAISMSLIQAFSVDLYSVSIGTYSETETSAFTMISPVSLQHHRIVSHFLPLHIYNSLF